MSKAVLTTIVTLFLLTGCKSHSKDKASAPPAGPAAPVTVAEINAAKLDAAVVPQAVRTAFNRDYPNAALDKVEMQSTSQGMSFYKLSFISGGQPGAASYYATGGKAP